MKKISMALALVLCVATGLHAGEAAPGSRQCSDIGRYELFQGTFTTLDLKYSQTSATHNAVFLLDTVTGQVKRYSNRIDEDGRYIETWLPTDITQPMGIKKTVAPQAEGKP